VLGALSIIAVLLTVLGTYVLAETMAAARRREMGIRAALGATRRQLGDLVLRETVHLVGLGLLAGLGLAWLGAGTIRAFLFQVEPLDVATLASVSGLILTLALGVSLRPAIRAGRVELARLLRED
jgi:putative ABC transport system permease protein